MFVLQIEDYIRDYVGELITQEEYERRGRFYDMQYRSFLFKYDMNNRSLT
jgi:hypothetical protein